MNEWTKDGGFYSEFGEDLWITQNLPIPPFGVYLDVGAGHPYYASNTAIFRDRMWRGLAIDGNPRWLSVWDTPFFCAVISKEPVVKFEENGLLSRISPTGHEQLGMPLQGILNGFGIEKIDVMSIDLEGSEYDAFQTFDLERHQPKIIIGEYSTLGIGDDFRLRDHLLARGYRVAHQTQANLIYVRE